MFNPITKQCGQPRLCWAVGYYRYVSPAKHLVTATMLLLTSCKYHNGIRNINVICFFIAAGAQMKHRLNEQFSHAGFLRGK